MHWTRFDRKLTRHLATALQRAIEWTIILLLTWSLIAFIISWWPMLIHPAILLNNLRPILEDIFTLIVLLEIRDLLHTMSVPRLLDIMATVVARKAILDQHSTSLLLDVIGLVILIVGRAIWKKLFPAPEEGTLDQSPPSNPPQ